MAGGQERILRRRIKSVQATKKITRAMELIAGSRIVRAQQRVHAAMPYSDQITHVVRDLAAAGGEISMGRTSAGRAMKTGPCSATQLASTRSISAAALAAVSVVCATVISL